MGRFKALVYGVGFFWMGVEGPKCVHLLSFAFFGGLVRYC